MSLRHRFASNTCRLASCLALVFIFFLAELIVGHVCGSLSLQADAFHMLSDSISLLLSLISVRLEKRPADETNTFGWQRASVVGPLINAVMLQTLCFTITLHAMEHLVDPHNVENPQLMLAVGVGGLVINLLSLLILHGTHAHSHGEPIPVPPVEEDDNLNEDSPSMPDNVAPQSDHQHHGHSHGSGKGAKNDSVFAAQLHVMADLIGSVVVIISALIIWLAPKLLGGDAAADSSNANATVIESVKSLENVSTVVWTKYVDPLLSLVLVLIVSWKNVPFLLRLIQVLMQSVPHSVQIPRLMKKIKMMPNVIHIHDLHVWQLRKDCLIGTVHLVCHITDVSTRYRITHDVKLLFHHANIHCTTIQVESDQVGGDDDAMCRQLCPDRLCVSDECCNGRTHKRH